jgi:hypothetical protein
VVERMIKDRKQPWKTGKKKGTFKKQNYERNERIFRYGAFTLHNCRECR